MGNYLLSSTSHHFSVVPHVMFFAVKQRGCRLGRQLSTHHISWARQEPKNHFRDTVKGLYDAQTNTYNIIRIQLRDCMTHKQTHTISYNHDQSWIKTMIQSWMISMICSDETKSKYWHQPTAAYEYTINQQTLREKHSTALHFGKKKKTT